MIVARYQGTAPAPEFLRRIREHQIGGVILFSENTSGGTDPMTKAIRAMQSQARAAHDYPLLIMTHQEGGAVKRLAQAPPARAPNAMSSAAVAYGEGRATGTALRRLGVNLDLAPVADVERAPNSFLGTRAFGSQSRVVEQRACAFAGGGRRLAASATRSSISRGWARLRPAPISNRSQSTPPRPTCAPTTAPTAAAGEGREPW